MSMLQEWFRGAKPRNPGSYFLDTDITDWEELEYPDSMFHVGLCCHTRSDDSTYFGGLDEHHEMRNANVVRAVCDAEPRFEKTAQLFSCQRDYELLRRLFSPLYFYDSFGHLLEETACGMFFARLEPITPGRKCGVHTRSTRVSAEQAEPHVHCFACADGTYGFLYKTRSKNRYRVTLSIDGKDEVQFHVCCPKATSSTPCRICDKSTARFRALSDDHPIVEEIKDFFDGVTACDLSGFEAARLELARQRACDRDFDRFVSKVDEERLNAERNRKKKKNFATVPSKDLPIFCSS